MGPRASRSARPSLCSLTSLRQASSARRSVVSITPSVTRSKASSGNVPDRMNPSLARRQATGSRRQGPRRRRRSALVLIPLIIFGALAAAAVVLFVASVGVFAVYSQGLDDPAHMSDQINPIGDSVVYARDGKT